MIEMIEGARRARRMWNPSRRYSISELRLRCGLLVELQADIDRVVWINGAGVEFDVLNFSVFVNDEGCAARPLVFVSAHRVFLQNPVSGEDLVIHVAQEREGDADLLGEGRVGGRAVDADSKNFRVACLELGQISLIGLEFLRSTAGEGEDVEGEDYGLLAPVVA